MHNLLQLPLELFCVWHSLGFCQEIQTSLFFTLVRMIVIVNPARTRPCSKHSMYIGLAMQDCILYIITLAVHLVPSISVKKYVIKMIYLIRLSHHVTEGICCSYMLCIFYYYIL